eukprot:g7669.t1
MFKALPHSAPMSLDLSMNRVFVMRLLAFLAALCLSTSAWAEDGAGKPKQLLLISFDGAGSNALWARSREIARRNGAHFTYFLSCTLLIPRADAKTYKGPRQKAGRSNIGFALDRAEARERLGHVWQAHLEGHEIASHTCGHFDGRDWTGEDWSAEFSSFRKVMTQAWSALGAAGEEPAGWQDFVATQIRGFRAPYFSTGDAMAAAERRAGFAYDASLVTKGPVFPQVSDGLLRFGLPLIPEGPQQRPIIAMDYNLFIRHSAGVENPSRSAEFEDRAYRSFRAAFDKQYQGERIPLQIGLHFVEMNGGAYWRATERLVSEVCRQNDVACVSYSQAIPMIDDRHLPGSGYSSPSMTRPCLKILPWLALAAIVFVTVSPIRLRPHDIASVDLDRAGAFAVTALLFVMAYPRRWKLCIAFLMVGAGAIELTQLLSPTRHAHFDDAAVKAGGAAFGCAVGWSVNRFRRAAAA